MATVTKAPVLPAIKRRIRGGTPTFVVDGPAPARCALMFRVGRADETLLTGGVTHLVEHLALFPVGDQPYQYNGFVEAHRTVFHAAGRPEECLDFLASVTASLSDLPLDRLEHEHRVLGAEAAGRGPGLYDALVSYRFGPRGLGMIGYPQFGVQRMSGSQIEAWRDRWFTASNAALVVSGVPVEALRLRLPAGERRPPVLPPQVETDLPAWFPFHGSGVGVSMIAERGAALSAGLRIAEKRLHRRLRTELAIVYSVGVSSQYLDARSLHVVMACDPVAEHAGDAVEALQEELDRLATDGPHPSELEADRAGLDREWEDPNAGYAVADLMATDELHGAERRTPAAITRAVRSVTVDAVAATLDQARRTALWCVPEGGAGPAGVRRVSSSSAWRAEGRRLPRARSASADAPPSPAERLVVGNAGVGIDYGEECSVHVAYERCQAVLSWDDGARILYADDGFVLRIRPWEWAGGAKAVAEVDARLDPALVVDMGEGEGPPAAPEPPKAQQRRRRWARGLGGLALVLAGLLAVVLPFTGPTVRPSEVTRLPPEAIPVDDSGFVACGGSALSVVLNGAHGPAAAECEADARFQLGIAAFSSVGFAGGAAWLLRRRTQAHVKA